MNIKCPCCENYTHDNDLYLFEICEVCGWQYDGAHQKDPNATGGANAISLNKARDNYKKFGASKERLVGTNRVRLPLVEELPENNI